jgi:hypothetical protein
MFASCLVKTEGFVAKGEPRNLKTGRRGSHIDTRRPSNGKKTLHELAIRGILERDCRIGRNGFKDAMRALALTDWQDIDPMPLDIVPDAYLVDTDAQELTLFEVGDWRLMTHDKEARLGAFWFWWDTYVPDWSVRCIAINRFGRVTHEIDLAGLYLDTVAAFAPRFQEALAGRSNEKGGS